MRKLGSQLDGGLDGDRLGCLDVCARRLSSVQCTSNRRLRYTKPLVLFTESVDAERYLYARTAERTDDVTVWTPELDGVSGAMLWRISDEEDDDVACVLQPAAIQVAFTHNAHLRAESIACVLELLKTSRPQ